MPNAAMTAIVEEHTNAAELDNPDPAAKEIIYVSKSVNQQDPLPPIL